jgi:hypothetical protein
MSKTTPCASRQARRKSERDRVYRGNPTPTRALARPLGPPIASIKKELALWRGFLGDEIDAILHDKD